MAVHQPFDRRWLDDGVVARLEGHLSRLYAPEQVAPTLAALVDLLASCDPPDPGALTSSGPLDERDVVLIAYPDQVVDEARSPLRSLDDFLRQRFGDTIRGVHLLPFYPASSDDGFAVVNYRQVDPRLGTWDDVHHFGESFKVMADAVFNHVSANSPWFRGWCDGNPRYEGFFIDLDPDTDLSAVVRPRATPVLTMFETVTGPRWVWTTFSADQVDLDYGNPRVLLEVTDVLLGYIRAGVSIIRLDAVAYLWKEPGTSCIHLPQTHEIVRLWRTVLDTVAPGTLLITETNVPHGENVAYFGNGHDEAHLVYQFPLAPLVLSAFHLADTTTLQEWISTLSTPSDSTAFFNFLGSHDGIGLRPVEGLLTPSEIAQLVALSTAHGGGVSYRTRDDGTLAAYELNSVFFDALTEAPSPEPPAVQVRRSLAAQSILLALAGVPGIYFHALVGSRNWHEGVDATGQLRAINRQKLDGSQLQAELDDPGSLRRSVATGMVERIRARTSHRAFHPNGAQRLVPTDVRLLVFERQAPDRPETVLCIHNVSGREVHLALEPDQISVRGRLRDLVGGAVYTTDERGGLSVQVSGYGVLWLCQQQ